MASPGQFFARFWSDRRNKRGAEQTFSFDDIDWEDEVRIFLEERSSFSPDSMTGLEANLRFAGPETMETKIFGRLTAWQNWIFQRPNAVGEEGALKKYGSGNRSKFNWERVTELYNEVKMTKPNEWWIVSDDDEFHVYPKPIREMIDECENFSVGS